VNPTALVFALYSAISTCYLICAIPVGVWVVVEVVAGYPQLELPAHFLPESPAFWLIVALVIVILSRT